MNKNFILRLGFTFFLIKNSKTLAGIIYSYFSDYKYDERKLVGIKGNHPLRLSIINLAIVNSTVKEMVKNLL